MLTELAIHDLDIKDIDVKNTILSGLSYYPDYISVYPYYLKAAKKYIEGSDTLLTCPIDFPSGIIDLKNRQQEILSAIKNGASKVDVVIPTCLIINRKYDKLREDIKSNYDICLSNNIKIHYMLEYRLFDHNILTKVCEILLGLGVSMIYPSTGHMLDDLSDNLIACAYLTQKTGIKTIANGNIWRQQQVQLLCNVNTPIKGVRCHNLRSLIMLYENTQSQK